MDPVEKKQGIILFWKIKNFDLDHLKFSPHHSLSQWNLFYIDLDLLPALRTSNYYFIHINLILVICLHIEHRLFSLIRLGTNRILINFKILKMQCTILKNALNHKLLFLIEEIWTTAMIFFIFIFLTFFGEMNAFFKNLWNLPSTRGRHPGQSLRDLNPGPGEYGIRDENRNSKL